MAAKLPKIVSKKELTATFFEKYLWHDTENGQLIWKPRPIEEFTSIRIFKSWNTKYSNKPIACVRTCPYGHSVKNFSFSGKTFVAHRVIAVMAGLLSCYGDPLVIDHIDGNPLNDVVSNLRAVTVSVNQRNTKKNIKSKTRCTGVDWDKTSNRWRARIGNGARRNIINTFHDDWFEAVCSRKSMEVDLGYTARHGK